MGELVTDSLIESVVNVACLVSIRTLESLAAARNQSSPPLNKVFDDHRQKAAVSRFVKLWNDKGWIAFPGFLFDPNDRRHDRVVEWPALLERTHVPDQWKNVDWPKYLKDFAMIPGAKRKKFSIRDELIKAEIDPNAGVALDKLLTNHPLILIMILYKYRGWKEAKKQLNFLSGEFPPLSSTTAAKPQPRSLPKTRQPKPATQTAPSAAEPEIAVEPSLANTWLGGTSRPAQAVEGNQFGNRRVIKNLTPRPGGSRVLEECDSFIEAWDRLKLNRWNHAPIKLTSIIFKNGAVVYQDEDINQEIRIPNVKELLKITCMNSPLYKKSIRILYRDREGNIYSQLYRQDSTKAWITGPDLFLNDIVKFWSESANQPSGYPKHYYIPKLHLKSIVYNGNNGFYLPANFPAPITGEDLGKAGLIEIEGSLQEIILTRYADQGSSLLVIRTITKNFQTQIGFTIEKQADGQWTLTLDRARTTGGLLYFLGGRNNPNSAWWREGLYFVLLALALPVAGWLMAPLGGGLLDAVPLLSEALDGNISAILKVVSSAFVGSHLLEFVIYRAVGSVRGPPLMNTIWALVIAGPVFLLSAFTGWPSHILIPLVVFIGFFWHKAVNDLLTSLTHPLNQNKDAHSGIIVPSFDPESEFAARQDASLISKIIESPGKTELRELIPDIERGSVEDLSPQLSIYGKIAGRMGNVAYRRSFLSHHAKGSWPLARAVGSLYQSATGLNRTGSGNKILVLEQIVNENDWPTIQKLMDRVRSVNGQRRPVLLRLVTADAPLAEIMRKRVRAGDPISVDVVPMEADALSRANARWLHDNALSPTSVELVIGVSPGIKIKPALEQVSDYLTTLMAALGKIQPLHVHDMLIIAEAFTESA